MSPGEQNNKKDNKTKNPYSIDEILRSEQGTSGAIVRKRRYSDSDSGEDIDEGENKAASKSTTPENVSKGPSYITAAKGSITEVQEERNSDDDETTTGRYRDHKGHIA